jgi:glutamyl-tRNA reductase
MTATPFVLGLSHHTAPIAVREALALAKEDVPGFLAELRAAGLSEVMVLSTCNRFEVYGVGDDAARAAAESLVAGRGGLHETAGLMSLRTGDDAVRHGIRVAAGLDSLVLGEPQVFGQVKDAYRLAESAGTLGPALAALRHGTFSAAKRIRTETGIGRHAASVPHAAVELAGRIFGRLAGRRVLLVGAGHMCRLAARRLAKEGASIVVVGRTLARAGALARPLAGRALPWTALGEEVAAADVVLAGTSARGIVITKEQVEAAVRVRGGRPLLMVDMALPRDIDPEARGVRGVFLYDVDGLQGVVDANLQARRREAAAAERMVQEEARAILGTFASLDAAPILAQLRRRSDEIRRQEMERARRRMGSLTPAQEEALEALGASLVEKLLRGPAEALRQRAREGRLHEEAGLVRTVLGLS